MFDCFLDWSLYMRARQELKCTNVGAGGGYVPVLRRRERDACIARGANAKMHMRLEETGPHVQMDCGGGGVFTAAGVRCTHAVPVWFRSSSAGSARGLIRPTPKILSAAVEHCSAIPCHSMLWRDVTLQIVLYFAIVFDVIACT